MEHLRTGRLVIRNFGADDWVDLLEFARQYQASDVAQYDHRWPTDAEGIQGAVDWFAGGDAYLAVCLQSTGKLIGFVCLNPSGRSDGDEPDLGYGFNFHYHGCGYATEACRALLDRAFACGVQRVVAGTALANTGSRRLLARLGFTQQPGQTEGAFAVTREEYDAAKATTT